MNRYFIFLYVEDKILAKMLDLAIYLLNPEEKWHAHVTVAGPYADKKSVPRNLDFEKIVSVLGVGRFTNPSQSTVFLKVGFSDIDEVWDKPDFKKQAKMPHLTIYDGDDLSFSCQIYEKMHKERLFFRFNVNGLEIVNSIKHQKSFGLIPSIDTKFLPETVAISPKEIASLKQEERLDIAMAIMKKAKSYSHGFLSV